MTKEVGTLKELNVRSGDVVERITGPSDLIGMRYTIFSPETYGNRNRSLAKGDLWAERKSGGWSPLGSKDMFRIISRASETPKLWRDMTDEEKGALLLARHEGKVIEYCLLSGWKEDPAFAPQFHPKVSYRVKPEPVRKVMVLEGANYGQEWEFDEHKDSKATHRITFDLLDGKPDCTSIKMEEI